MRDSSPSRGFTLAELVMVVALIAVLAAMALPVAKFTVKRRPGPAARWEPEAHAQRHR